MSVDLHLAQLGLGVHDDLTHFTLEVFAGQPDAAFVAQPLALAAGASSRHLPSASGQDAVTLQHQFVLCTWWRTAASWARLDKVQIYLRSLK